MSLFRICAVEMLLPMENPWKQYFTFTKNERTGIIVLLVLIIAVTVLPYCYSVSFTKPEPIDERLLSLVQQLNDSTNDKESKPAYYRKDANEVEAMPVTLFEFDPNTLSAEGWKKLGVHGRIIQTIQRYLAKGGRFRKAEDLARIYGLAPAQAAQLLPYVKITDTSSSSQYTRFPASFYSKATHKAAAAIVIDINTADTTAFIALPGIGSRLAQRIVNFRDKLGGFYAVEQLAETYGLPDSVFQRVRVQLQCNAEAVQKMNINTVSAEALKQHPYLRWNFANAIIKFREQHGAFRSAEDLQQIEILTPELIRKLLPYLAFE
ncbi:MAG: helix-hairpin-helix domain-containing protein [Chitinophagaceae bacterium]